MTLETLITNPPGFQDISFTESSAFGSLGDNLEWLRSRGANLWSAREAAAAIIAEGPGRQWGELFLTRTAALYFTIGNKMHIAFDDLLAPTWANVNYGIAGKEFRKGSGGGAHCIFPSRFGEDSEHQTGYRIFIGTPSPGNLVYGAILRAEQKGRIIDAPKKGPIIFDRTRPTDAQRFEQSLMTRAVFQDMTPYLSSFLWSANPQHEQLACGYSFEEPRKLREQGLRAGFVAARIVSINTYDFKIQLHRRLDSIVYVRGISPRARSAPDTPIDIAEAAGVDGIPANR